MRSDSLRESVENGGDFQVCTLELFCMREASNLKRHPWGFAVVVLPQRNAMFVSQLDQMLAAPLQQTTIRRMGNRLWHHRRIDDQPIKTGRLHCSNFPGGIDSTPSSPIH